MLARMPLGRVFRVAGGAAVLALAVVLPASAQLTCDPCTIGVALDGPWDRNDIISGTIEQEVLRLAGDQGQVTFPADKRRVADWTFAGASASVDTLLADPEVDMVLAAGPLSSAYVIRRPGLPKPVIAIFVPDPVAQTLPRELDANDDRVSGIPNLTYVTYSGNAPHAFSRFAEVAPFEHLAVLIMDELLAAEPTLATPAPGVSGFRMTVVPASASADEILARLPDDVDAVFVTPITHMPPEEFDRLVQALIDRKLPSFSFWGRTEVERGLLTSIYADTDYERMGRRVAIDVQRLLEGEAAADLPVDFVRGERLSLNMTTARAIDVHPSWEIYTEAELIGEFEDGEARRLNLTTVAGEAILSSLALAAADHAINAGAQEVRAAGSVFRPQLSFLTATQVIDEDRAAASFGSAPQRALAATATASQLLYSDAARANVEIREHQQMARRYASDEAKLDAVHQAVVAYLNVLRANTFERIQRDNLITTRSHLELAQARLRLGVGRQQEVLRWESQLATNRRDVISANAGRNQAQLELNRLLDRPLEEPFVLDDVDLRESSLLTSAEQLDPFVNNPFAFDIFRNFMADEALRTAPELRQLDEAIRAQTRASSAASRALWSPTVGLQFDMSTITSGGAGSTLQLPFEVPVPPTAPNRLNWTFGVSASLPVFSGGARYADIARTSFELSRLRVERRAAANLVEQRLRSTLHAAGASHAGIRLTEDAADAATRNLDLVEEAYTRGAVSIIDLIDAQNAQLTAEQRAASAIYDYLVDLMNAQRAVGQFDFFISMPEHQAFLERLRTYFEAAGYRVAGGRW
jgi:outer membrane protein TolC/ABC-type uncharacterized transport system substrate-binding protein